MQHFKHANGDTSASAHDLRGVLRNALAIVNKLPVVDVSNQAEMRSESGNGVGPAQVKQVINERRTRDALFPDRLFADPAWDMLLELYHWRLRQCRISTTSLCEAAAVPATTALRWVTALETAGLLERKNDPLDKRRVFAELSPQGTAKMEAYFAKIRR